MKFDRIVVFGDFHGDLDTMLNSMAKKGLIRYDGEIKAVIKLISENEFEAMVIPQAQPVRMIFLGDYLDRYHFGYHIIQFLDKIRWEEFGIHPIFFMGNHDLINFHFFLNPFEISEIYHGCGHSKCDTLSYINNMGLHDSLESFKALHGDEIVKKQIEFYETGRIEYQDDFYTLRYEYPQDMSPLAEYRHYTGDDYSNYYNQDERIRLLYKRFKEATGIERVICGHTPFKFEDKPEIRFLMSRELQAIGLEYLCIDNACSIAYSEDTRLNGIEIDRDGKILDMGEIFTLPN